MYNYDCTKLYRRSARRPLCLSYCRRTDGQKLVRYQCGHIMDISGQLNILNLVHGNNFIFVFLFILSDTKKTKRKINEFF